MTQLVTPPDVRYRPVILALAGVLSGLVAGLALTATGPVTGITDVSRVLASAVPSVRVVLLCAAVATVGLSLIAVLVEDGPPELARPVLARVRPAAVAAAMVWSAAAFVSLLLQVANYRPQQDTIAFAEVWEYAFTIGTGKAMLMLSALALAHATVGLVAVRYGERVPADLRLALALIALALLPVAGHGAEWSLTNITTLSMQLHVIAVVTWTGGLGAMAVLLTADRTLLARALPRFSKVATVCLVVAVATGVPNALAELSANPNMDLRTALVRTPYGQLVALKFALTGAIVLVAAHLRRRLMPRIAEQRSTAVAAWATLELAIMGAVMGLAAVLIQAQAA